MHIGIPDDADLIRVPLERTDLGEGLARVVTVWKGREKTGAPFEELGICDGFELDLGEGRDPFELEIDRSLDFYRRVHLLWPSGEIDCSNTAAQLLELARLLGRPEVVALLAEWAAEDAAADEAESLPAKPTKPSRPKKGGRK